MTEQLTSPSSPRLCVTCRHWRFYGGSPGYSDETPGSGGSIECTKGHYYQTIDEIRDASHYREVISVAATCPDYEAVEDGG